MTVDPTALQQARLHIGYIRVCWPLLGEARTARVSRGSVALSGRAAAARDEGLRAERADRDAAVSYRALAASPAPLALGVLDAEEAALETLRDIHDAIRSDLHHWSRYLHSGQRTAANIEPWLTWTTEALAWSSAELVDQAARDLPPVARALMRAVGIVEADEWRPSGLRCPVCGQRAITVWDRSSDRREWTRECTGQREDGKPCRCDGDGCDCERTGARAGSRHLWPA